MASSFLSNISLSSTPRISLATNLCSPSLRLVPKSLTSAALFLPRNPQCSWREGGILLSSSSPVEAIDSRLASRRCYSSSADFIAIAKEGEEHPVHEEKEQEAPSQNNVNLNSLHDIGTLLRRYRESILSGDEASAAEIQNLLCTIDARRNELVRKTQQLSSEIISGKEKYIRVQADFDNFRKSFDKEKLRMVKDGRGDVIESLLAVADTFERVRQMSKGAETEKEKKIEVSYQGIYKQFVEVMKGLQVAALPAVGKPFDPSVHECVGREESVEYKEGIVMQEIRRGFLLGDRVLRPATVKVSSGLRKKNSGPAAASEESTEDSLV